MSERPRRMTQAERTARTRAKVLATAIDCLHTEGYAATTTSLVAQRSGSLRLKFQFPPPSRLRLYRASAFSHSSGRALGQMTCGSGLTRR